MPGRHTHTERATESSAAHQAQFCTVRDIEHWVKGGKVEAMPVLKTAELKGILKIKRGKSTGENILKSEIMFTLMHI